jgi:hypothetical protein
MLDLGNAGDHARAYDSPVVVHDGYLAARHGVHRLVELESEAAARGGDRRATRWRSVPQLCLGSRDREIQTPVDLDPRDGECFVWAYDDHIRRAIRPEHVQRPRRGDAQAPPLARGELPVPVVITNGKTGFIENLPCARAETLPLEEVSIVTAAEEACFLAL